MDCNETRRLLDADLDGELDLVRHLEIEAHLRTCAECARRAENARARRAALREALPRFTAPAALAEKIRASLRAENPGVRAADTPRLAPVVTLEAASALTPDRAPEPTPMLAPVPMPALAPTRTPAKIVFPVWQFAGLAAAIALALFSGYAWGGARARGNQLVTEAIADHVRSLQAAHLTDVASTDQHTVKPWFAGKLDFSPPVVDLASAGFPLTGGRLDQLDGRTAAALVFHRRQHAINLFIWPANDRLSSASIAPRNGYHATAWSQAGLSFLAISEIPSDELAQFAEAFRQATP